MTRKPVGLSFWSVSSDRCLQTGASLIPVRLLKRLRGISGGSPSGASPTPGRRPLPKLCELCELCVCGLQVGLEMAMNRGGGEPDGEMNRSKKQKHLWGNIFRAPKLVWSFAFLLAVVSA